MLEKSEFLIDEIVDLAGHKNNPSLQKQTPKLNREKNDESDPDNLPVLGGNRF